MFFLCLAQDSDMISETGKGVVSVNRTEYKNQHAKEHYDRINFTLPIGEKERIRRTASGLMMSVNEYLYALVCDDLASGESKFGKKKQGFSDEQRRMLEKWQVPKKYYDMIEDMSYSKGEGYFIYLKEGYVNDLTGSRSIHCEKTSEVRRIIGKTHRK